MILRTLFRELNLVYFLEKDPHDKVKLLLESYKKTDWKNHVKHNINWFKDSKLNKYHIKTPLFKNKSPYFDMFIVGFPPNYTTNIHNHDDSECFFKILNGCITEKKYKNNKVINNNLIYYNSPVINIGYVPKFYYHSIKNNENTPSFSLNVYTKNNLKNKNIIHL